MSFFNELVITTCNKAHCKVTKFTKVLNFIIDKVKKVDKLFVLILKEKYIMKNTS